jgi:hypothetical protein
LISACRGGCDAGGWGAFRIPPALHYWRRVQLCPTARRKASSAR